MRIKETLNLGKTKFPMRGNLPKREAEWEQQWDENKLYQQRLKLNEGKPSFILHDGPPFANGNIHMGHAMNKISKDIIVRYKNMSGYCSPFVPGWDTHGLPIEQQLAKKGINRKKISMPDYRELCRQYALSQVDKQRKDFKRLGIMADWEHPYITLQPKFEAAEIRLFGKMYEKGYIYKGKKPVYWSPSSESTLAEAEVEYKDITAHTMYVAFKLTDGKGIIDPTNTYCVIWTTTPWTIPANEAICVNPKFDYSVVQVEDKRYIIASGRVSFMADELGWSDYKVVQTVKGAELEYMKAVHPLYPDRESLLIEGFHVTLDEGTGLVHTAPGFGEDDFNVGQKYHLPVFSPIDNKGCYTDEVPELAGTFYADADQIILDQLRENGSLLKQEDIVHAYPHDWRTKKPVIYRATTQWFASIEPFRKELLSQIDQVSFMPGWGKTRLYNMIKDRGDWVISRQRAWGVPLPIFYAEDKTPIVIPETISHVAAIFEQEGSSAWFQHTAKELLPEDFSSTHSPHGEFTKEKDILDVWFDSGSSHSGVLKQRSDLKFPADLYLEGSDQYRGWFNSSLITSVAVNDKAPYKAILSQGFVLDDKGHKMSKSLGNVISPNDVVKQMGAEIIRLWVASADSTSDVAVSQDILRQTAEGYRKIRNTLRYMLANTTDFDPADRVSYEQLPSVDQYMMIRLNQLLSEVTKSYEHYNFSEVYKKIFAFISNDLSAFYLDFAKDVLYIEAKDSLPRRAMQTVIYQALVSLVKLMTPILPHTMEEAWQYLKEPEAYVQLTEMPKVVHYKNEAERVTQWQQFMVFRDDVLKALEDARNQKLIGKSFEACVTVYPTVQTQKMLTHLSTNVRQILIVSKFDLSTQVPPQAAKTFNSGSILITHADGQVCQRCRMTRTDVGINVKLPTICGRCAEIVEANFPQALQEGLEK